MNAAARRRLRLRLRDLSAAAAFLAVGLSGSVPLFVLGLFTLAFVLSFAGVRPLARQRGWSAAVLLLVAVVLFGMAFRGYLDLVVAAVSFAVLVTGHRMVSQPTVATDQQVLLASLLLVAGGAALSGELWFGLCLLGFGVFACLHLGLMVVEGPTERDEDLDVRVVLREVSVGVVLALVGAVAFFITFPRLSWNLASRRASPGVLGASTGMSDRVRLGGGGTIKTSARIVARVALEPDPPGDRLERYWVGRRFDVFDGKEWRGSGVDQPARSLVRFAASSMAATVQRIELTPAYGARTLIGLENPGWFNNARAIHPTGSVPTLMIESVGEEVRFLSEAPAYTYTVSSYAGTVMQEDDEELGRARVVPGVDPRVAALARQVAGGETGALAQARRLETFLKRSYQYSLDQEGPVADPLASFLFERKQGHCEHFATALAVMLRTLGVPARVTAGFFGGERVGATWVLRAGDAHAWVEAFIPGQGWMSFDATPEQARAGRPSVFLARLTDAVERVEEWWRRRVVDYSILDQVSFMRRLVRPPQGATTGAGPAELSPDERRPFPRWPWALGGAVAAGFIIAAAARRRRTRVHPATGFLHALEKLIAQAPVARRPGETLEELARRLDREGHVLKGSVGPATRRYLEARFGSRPLSAQEAHRLLEAVRAQVREVRA